MILIRFILLSQEIVNDFLDKNCPQFAGAISFYTLFSMFPLILAVTSVLGFLLGPRAEEEQLEIAMQIAEVIPVSSGFISQTMEGLVNARTITGIASVIGAVLGGDGRFRRNAQRGLTPPGASGLPDPSSTSA